TILPSDVVLFCFVLFFFFNATATTEIYTLSLHDALPISLAAPPGMKLSRSNSTTGTGASGEMRETRPQMNWSSITSPMTSTRVRSEEHTSELQSRRDLVCRLLLEKKKKKNIQNMPEQTCN